MMLTDDDIRDALEAEFLGEPGNRNLADDLRVARAAIAAHQAKAAPAVPQGWKLVPVEPTPDMEGAGRVNMAYGSCTARQVWIAMLAATPAATSQPAAPSLIAPNAVWLIHYDDADRRPEILTSEQAARAYFQRISGQWNAHLFVKVESNSRDDRFYSLNASMATAPSQESPDEWAECKRISELPEVDEALRLFAEGETTEDQAVAIVQTIIAAMREKEGK